MPKLPLTVTEVNYKGGTLYEVRVAFADGSTMVYLVPLTLATVEAVTISAVALGVLNDLHPPFPAAHGPSHRRYDPRP